jgi:hypothetical protein
LPNINFHPAGLQARKAEVKESLTAQQATIHQNFLKDFDWKMNVCFNREKNPIFVFGTNPFPSSATILVGFGK